LVCFNIITAPSAGKGLPRAGWDALAVDVPNGAWQEFDTHEIEMAITAFTPEGGDPGRGIPSSNTKSERTNYGVRALIAGGFG